jgi:hypothetical protein
MYKTCPYYINTLMNTLYPTCHICNMYSCPYCGNAPMYNSGFSKQFANYVKEEDTDIINFIPTLNARGFIIQEGKLSYVNILKLCSDGKVDSALGNNVGAPMQYVCFHRPQIRIHRKSSCLQRAIVLMRQLY